LYLVEINSPPASLLSLKSQSSQSYFFFSLSAERAESEKQQPFGQNIYHLLSANMILNSILICIVSGGLSFYVCRPLNGKHKLSFLCALSGFAVKNNIKQ
jgi:hypothetical protein